MEKERFEVPKAEVILFSWEDVIATSGVIETPFVPANPKNSILE